MKNFTVQKTMYCYATIVLFFLSSVTFAQKSVTDSSAANKSFFKASAGYLSDNVYYVRKDSVRAPYLTPQIGYYNKSGFYVEGSTSFLVSAQSTKLDLVTFDAGYDFHSKNEKLDAGISYTKSFYSQSSNSVKSNISGDLGSYVSYDFGPVTLNGSADYLFASKPDIITSISASHSFLFGSNSDFSFSPAAAINAGTQNYYVEFRKTKNPALIEKGLHNTDKYNILDYEFSAPIAYDAAKWGMFFTPAYAIPVNPVEYNKKNGVTVYKEPLASSFYFQAGVYVKL